MVGRHGAPACALKLAQECVMGKLLIMSSTPGSLPPENQGPVLAPGPITPSDVRTLFTAVDIYRSLGTLEKAVDILESTTKSNVEKIHQVTRQADETKFAFSILDKAVALHGDRLRRLDKVAFVGEIAGAIVAAGIFVPLLTYLVTYLVHYFSAHFPK